MPKIKKSGFHANKTKLGFQKTWLLCHKIWLSRQTNKNRLPCHKTKFGSHATKSLASMPQNQNLAFTPQKSALMPKTGFHATKPKLSFHATKIGFHAKNRLSCQTKFWLSRHLKFGFQAIKKTRLLYHKNWLPCHKQNFGFHATKIGSHAKNQAFCHKIWLSCLKTTI